MTAQKADREHGRWNSEIPAYALGALPEPSAAELERHLERCEACRSELEWLRPAVDLLPATVPQEPPPARLRKKLLREVRADAAASAPRGAVHPPWWMRFRRTVLSPAIGLAAILLLAMGVAAGYLLSNNEGEQSSEVVAARSLRGADVSATLEAQSDLAVLHINSLPRIGPRRVYEVWVEQDAVLEPAGTFVPSADGSANAAIRAPLAEGQAVYVTEEPRGGSTRPTTAPLLRAQL